MELLDDNSQGFEENEINEVEQEEVLELSKEELPGAVEALLFSVGESMEISTIADTLLISEAETEEILDNLADRYTEAGSGIELVRLENSVQLGTKRDYYKVIKKIVSTPPKYSLTDTMLETLSIVAYKQPVTRIEIEKIRGVACDRQINKLLEYDLIRELGRLDAPGRPLLFGTTEQFLKSFGVSSIEELPQAGPDKIADLEAEALKEVQQVKI